MEEKATSDCSSKQFYCILLFFEVVKYVVDQTNSVFFCSSHTCAFDLSVKQVSRPLHVAYRAADLFPSLSLDL